MAKINQSSLTELVEQSRQFRSAGDFVAKHSNPISGQNSFLIKQGSIDTDAIPETRISPPHFSTAPGNVYANDGVSVFAENSDIYEILWEMCLNPVV